MYSPRLRKRKISEQVVPGVAEPSSRLANYPQSSTASSSQTSNPFGDANYPIPDFQRIYDLMRHPLNGLRLADRRWGFSNYTKCFIGTEAVQWLVDNLSVEPTKAEETGQKLMEAGIIHHVTNSEPFCDAYYFYRFQEDDDGNILNMKRIWDSNIPTRDAVVVAKDLITKLAFLCEEHRRRILDADASPNKWPASPSLQGGLQSQSRTPIMDPTMRPTTIARSPSLALLRSSSTPLLPSSSSLMLISPDLRRFSQSKHQGQKDDDINYSSLAKSERFRQYSLSAAELQRVQLVALNHDESLAFFVNVYNALCLHAHVVHGPPNTVYRRFLFFRCYAYRVAGLNMTLDDIEHGILRGNKRAPFIKFLQQFRPTDPKCQHVLKQRDGRIHFIISAGTKSDPPIPILDGENVQEELHDASLEFLSCSVKVDVDKRTVTLPRIFWWYKDDFPTPDKNLLLWVAKYLPDTTLYNLVSLVNDDGPIPTITYENFEWSNPEAKFNASVVRRKRRRLERERDLDEPQDMIDLVRHTQGGGDLTPILPTTPILKMGEPSNDAFLQAFSPLMGQHAEAKTALDLDTTIYNRTGSNSQQDCSSLLPTDPVTSKAETEKASIQLAVNESKAKPQLLVLPNSF